MNAPTNRMSAAGAPAVARDVIACLSLATLCYWNVWIELTNTSLDYFRKVPASGIAIAAAAINVALLASLFLALLALYRRLRSRALRRAGQALFVLFLLVPLNVARKSVTEVAGLSAALQEGLGPSGAIVFLSAAAAAIAALMLWRPAAVTQGAVAALLIASPLLPLLAAQAVWTHLRRDRAGTAAATTVPPKRAPGGGPRIVWLLFDEWDYRLTFEGRPARITLPHIDRLRREAFDAGRTVGGGGFDVPHAIPSLLTGRRVVAERDGGPRDVLIRTPESPDFVPWSRQPSVFSTLRDQGWTTAAVGWYVPYCRVLGRHFSACEWEAGGSIYDRAEYSTSLSLLQATSLIAERQVSRVPMLAGAARARQHSRQRQLQVREYENVRAAAHRLLTSADLVYVHWPVPHPLGIYDVATGRTGAHAAANYFDNLALTDRTIGELRQRLESRDMWDGATVILTSDHSLRVGDWRGSHAWSGEEAQATGNRQSPYVPLLVKLAGSRQGRTYDRPISMLLIHDLVLALAREEVRTNEELAGWLDRNRPRFPLRRRPSDARVTR